MSVQSVALASLTATYTDSEGDDGLDDEHHRDSSNTPRSRVPKNAEKFHPGRSNDSPLFGRSASSSPDVGTPASAGVADDAASNPSAFTSNAPILVTDVTTKVQRLVSYFDDTVISDDEMGTAHASGELLGGPSDNGAFLGIKNDKNEKNATQSPKRRGELVSDGDIAAESDADAAWGVTIPPEPSGQCPVELQEKIVKLCRRMDSGLDMNRLIQQRKEFRNPSIYEKLIQFCSINEMGTNYPPDRFDPFKWGKDSHYEELARVQKIEMDKLEKVRKEKTKIEIVSGTAKRSAPGPPSNNNSSSTSISTSASMQNDEDAKRRKSKWDQVATGTNASVKSSIVMSQPTLTTLTSSATGTKATVISAFGSLPKKRL